MILEVQGSNSTVSKPSTRQASKNNKRRQVLLTKGKKKKQSFSLLMDSLYDDPEEKTVTVRSSNATQLKNDNRTPDIF
jgi:hypothetical protein